MLSCKFEGSEVVERQNKHFAASLRNHIKWENIGSEQFLDVDVKLNVVLEVVILLIFCHVFRVHSASRFHQDLHIVVYDATCISCREPRKCVSTHNQLAIIFS